MKSYFIKNDPTLFVTLGKQATAKRAQSHKVAELRMIHKEARALAERVFILDDNLDCAILNDTLLTAGELAGNLADTIENQ